MANARLVALVSVMLTACGPQVEVSFGGETEGVADGSGSGAADPMDTTSSGPRAEDSGAAEETGEVAECGNGIVEGDEACDDGPDGSPTCSPNCTPRCALIWERSMPSNPDGGQRFTNVGVGPNGDIWTVEPPNSDPLEVSRHAHDGEKLWTTTHERDTSFLFNRLVVSSRGVLSLWGMHTYTEGHEMLLVELGPDGAQAAEHTYGTPIYGSQAGQGIVMTDEEHRLVSGARMLTTVDREAWLAMLDTEGTVTWERSYSGVGTETHSMDLAGPVAYAPGLVAAIVLEYLGPQHFAHHLLVFDVTLEDPILDVVLPIDGTDALTHQPLDLVIDEAGEVFVLYAHHSSGGFGSSRWTVYHYDTHGTLAGSLEHDAVGQDAGTMALRLVRAPAGELVIGGFAYVAPEFEPWFIVLEGLSVLCAWSGEQLVGALDLAVDDAGQVVLAGQDWRDGTSRPWLARLHGA